MSRVIYGFVGLACAMAGLWVVVPQVREAKGGVDQMTTASIARSGRDYSLSSMEAGADCTIVRGKKLPGGGHLVSVGPNCSAVFPGIVRVHAWRDKADGVVELIGEGGETLAAFSESDGVGYESFRPRAPFLKLTPKAQ